MNPILQGKINRLRVFRVVKAFMEANGRCPLATEIAESVGLAPLSTREHMRALIGATGLPMPIMDGKLRAGRANGKTGTEDAEKRIRRNVARHGTRYTDGPIPLDLQFKARP